MAPQHVGENAEMLRRVQEEFIEMPGLRLTKAQARRLWALDEVLCSTLLRALVDASFLFQTDNGSYMRVETATLFNVKVSPRVTTAGSATREPVTTIGN